ncbi:thymidylate kinase [Pokkaliibacter plantistimulans]|uniref:Thymidylate kinase n=1 Tax=Pokkaliibacter plantistimulans TaxID=1635171 RepID=A0ABX5M2T0_9GAMM|nr:dTMP kinase [Pokkaliibacter plantistimulans]PXF33220.1 thymidylate kinase [Pokkaliibacter plantistimulans]
MTRGCFITLEGTEGAGKTTALAHIVAWLEYRNIPYVLTREPGGTPIAEEIRQLVLSPRDEQVVPLSELLLVFAARAQHIEKLIKPTLNLGTWVVCDRFTDSTYAYQGGGRQLPFEPIVQLENLVQAGFQPDLTLLLDVTPEVGMRRASRRSAADRIEQEAMSFFQRAKQAFLARAESAPERFRVINADQNLESVKDQITQALSGWSELHRG